MKIYKWLIGFTVLLTFLASAYFYPQLPAQMATHWNAAGEVDGTSSKLFGALLVPIISLLIALILFFVPRVDPLGKNIEEFHVHYHRFIFVLILFLFVLHLQMLLWNIGVQISLNFTMPIALGVLLIVMGFMLKHAKRNWTVGIRTPWTLSSDHVWNKTHKLGSKLFIAAGIISIFSVFVPAYALYIAFAPLIAVVVVLLIYSYVVYRAEKKN